MAGSGPPRAFRVRTSLICSTAICPRENSVPSSPRRSGHRSGSGSGALANEAPGGSPGRTRFVRAALSLRVHRRASSGRDVEGTSQRLRDGPTLFKRNPPFHRRVGRYLRCRRSLCQRRRRQRRRGGAANGCRSEYHCVHTDTLDLGSVSPSCLCWRTGSGSSIGAVHEVPRRGGIVEIDPRLPAVAADAGHSSLITG